MKSIVKEINYNNIEEFFDNILSQNGALYTLFNNKYKNRIVKHFIFRGEPSADFKLIPNALRLEKRDLVFKLGGNNSNHETTEYQQIEAEYEILTNFNYKCDYHGLTIPKTEELRIHYRKEFSLESLKVKKKWIDDNFFELAGLAQHYGLPTRLLDWTKDFHVALYFAVLNSIKNNQNGNLIIWCFDYTSYQIYSTHRARNPFRLIQPEYFLNPNLSAQKGLFTLWQIEKPQYKSEQTVDRTPLNELIENHLEVENDKFPVLFYKLILPANNLEKLSTYLMTNNYDGAKIFPGYGGVVKSIFEAAEFNSNDFDD